MHTSDRRRKGSSESEDYVKIAETGQVYIALWTLRNSLGLYCRCCLKTRLK
jgi:hypothetical protein